MKAKDFTHCIITNETNRPMSWSGRDQQLCLCDDGDDDHWKGDIHPVRVVTIETAKKQIARTKANRIKWGFNAGEYKIFPVKL